LTRIARKGVSPVVATLLLILIAVAAAVLLYTWVSGLSANVAGSKVSGKTLTVIQATWALGPAAVPYTATAFSADYPVLIISFKAPPAAVGGSGPGTLLTIDNVDVMYAGRVICHYNGWALSNGDVQHTGTSAGGLNGTALVFAGYYGSTQGALDDNDLYPPGGIAISFTKSPKRGTGVLGPGAVSADYDGKPTTLGDKSQSFVTIVAGVWNVQYVSTDKVETQFSNTTATIRFDRWLGSSVTVSGDGKNSVPLFDLAKVGQDDWSIVIYCKNVNPNVMNSVIVRLQFQDGSTWQTTVPLTVQ
jgi:flagellin-like protein